MIGSNEDTPPSSASLDTVKHSPEATDGLYGSMTSSQETLSREAGPDIDNQILARQKRRRTSPEDQAILEAEYERNSKPDKAARIVIVDRVALGEKEVQIWFQNRRQMTRRKSRPLLPHEIFSFRSSQEHSDNAVNSSFTLQSDSQQQLASSQTSAMNSQPTVNDSRTKVNGTTLAGAISSSIHPITAPLTSSGTMTHCPNNGTGGSVQDTDALASEAELEGSRARITDLIGTLSQTKPIKRRPGYFANRRSASFIIHDEHRDVSQLSGMPIEQTETKISAIPSLQPLKRTPSHVRLSLSLEGKAEVRTGDEATPSPPRSQQMPLINPAPRPLNGLQRSYSALEPNSNAGNQMFPALCSRRGMTGRSRDARTWEFYCDSDARNALTEQAEREESGSAIAAISLIRSHSNKAKAMTPNRNKRNGQPHKSDSAKRLKADGQKASKPKLGRATSSVARLQTTNDSAQRQKPVKAGHKHSKSNSQHAIYQDYDGDSDKENWEPGTQTSNPPRHRPSKSRQAARILEESLRVPSQSSSLDALMSRGSNSTRQLSGKTSGSKGKENGLFDNDGEVAAFMGESVPREVEDLDCVQNLLSLSQAAWQ